MFTRGPAHHRRRRDACAQLNSPQVADLKRKIQESQTFPAENQKLIYSGALSRALVNERGPD